MINCEM